MRKNNQRLESWQNVRSNHSHVSFYYCRICWCW